MKKYMLISVCEREIETLQTDTLEEAQERMLRELKEFGGVESPAIGMEGPDYEIDEMSAWSKVKEYIKQDCLIVELEQ